MTATSIGPRVTRCLTCGAPLRQAIRAPHPDYGVFDAHRWYCVNSAAHGAGLVAIWYDWELAYPPLDAETALALEMATPRPEGTE
jgi:hypothetical protein